MSAVLSPIVSEFETEEQEASYNLWFRAKVEEAQHKKNPACHTIPPWPKCRPCSKKAAKPVQAIRWSDEATSDLVDIIDYIEQRKPFAAQNLYAAIVQSAENVPLMP
jgi:hypothetical protein